MIHLRHSWFGLVVALGLGLVAGCGKSDPQPSTRNSEPRRDQTKADQLSTSTAPTLRFHWLGKKRLSVEPNATNFMAIWKLPESVRLEAQTLDKLATAPWRLLKTATPLSNAPSALLRPLLDDLVQEESYLEMRGDTNEPTELVLALRLPADRAALWQTNLPFVLKSLFREVQTSSSRKSETKEEDNNIQLSVTANQSEGGSAKNYQLSLRRSGDWTLLAFTYAPTNKLLPVIQQRLTTDSVPYAPRATNYWVELQANLAPLYRWAAAHAAPTNLPLIELRLSGENGNVRTRGQLNFPHAFPIALGPWNVPTNLIRDPLVSFTAVRGLGAWLASLDAWRGLQLGEPPNQLYFWALSGPFQTFFATPQTNAKQKLAAAEPMIQRGNLWLATNGIGQLERLEAGNGWRWAGVPLMNFHVQSYASSAGEFIYGGWFPDKPNLQRTPPELLDQLLGHKGLIYYDWELTGQRIEGWIQIGQTTRLALKKGQLPPLSISAVWLGASARQLGNCVTAISQTGPSQWAITRSSGIGLTGIELHLLADWLESPEFPRGLHSLEVPAAFPASRGNLAPQRKQ